MNFSIDLPNISEDNPIASEHYMYWQSPKMHQKARWITLEHPWFKLSWFVSTEFSVHEINESVLNYHARSELVKKVLSKQVSSAHLSLILLLVMGCGGTLQGHEIPPPGRRRKSNWQQIWEKCNKGCMHFSFENLLKEKRGGGSLQGNQLISGS